MKRAGGLVAAIFILAGSLTSTYAHSLDDVLIRMKQKESTIKTLRFRFEQEVRFPDSGLNDRVAGEALFQKPKRMRIEKQLPQEQLTVSNGKNIWIYTPSFKQVWSGRSSDWGNQNAIPQGLMSLENYVNELETNFNLSLPIDAKADAVEIHIGAKPKKANADYQFDFYISTETWLPVKTVYTSPTAKVTTILSHMDVNPEVSDQAFNFSSPKGIDVIPLN